MMTADLEPLPLGHPLISRRSLPAVFSRATRDFFRQGLPFLQALLMPIMLIYGGTYAALLAALEMASGDERQPLLVGISLLGLIALLAGFWRFIVYFASFNRSYANILAGKPADCAVEYKRLLASHRSKLVWYVNGLVLVQVLSGVAMWFFTLPLAFFMPENAVGLVVQLLVYLSYTWVSMGFQILALGVPKSGPVGVLRQSILLVRRRFWVCCFTLLACFVLTYYLLPGAAVVFAELSGLVSWFNQFHQGAIYNYLVRLRELQGQFPTDIQPLLGQLSLFGGDLHITSADLSHQLSQTLMTSIVNSLLLPWGTFAYALLYGDLMAGMSAEADID